MKMIILFDYQQVREYNYTRAKKTKRLHWLTFGLHLGRVELVSGLHSNYI